MIKRANPDQSSKESIAAVLALNDYVEDCGLEIGLLELIKTRASQINGCAYCIDMHAREARAHGETEQRLYLLSAWEESGLFTAREMAALAWTEAVTLVHECQVPDALYNKTLEQFSAEELVKLTVAIGLINTWNRIAISFRYAVPASK